MIKMLFEKTFNEIFDELENKLVQEFELGSPKELMDEKLALLNNLIVDIQSKY